MVIVKHVEQVKADLHSANFSRANFAGECFLFNLHLKRMKFELFVKPHVLFTLR